MWRREERLKFWLENGSQSQKYGFGAGLIEKLSLKFRLRKCAGTVQEESLSLSTATVCLDDALATTTCVKDGLDDIGYWSHHELESESGLPECDGMVRSAMLIEGAKTFNVGFPNERFARIRQEGVEMAPTCRAYLVSVSAVEVHELVHPYSQPPMLMDGNRFLIAIPPIQNLTTQMAELSHSLTSVRIEELQESERKGFLREAEVLKGIPSDRAELLAVFRHVPIEVVSRLRFLAEKKTIVYSISNEVKPTRTRVHDLAAVLDITSKEIHLVPHRTQFQSVSLN
jgi:hypothetical protein